MEAGELPFDDIVAAVAPDRPPGRTPLVQVMLTLVEGSRPLLHLPGLTAAPLPLAKPTAGASVDLTLSIEETDGALEGWLEYNALLFDRGTVAAMAAQFQTLLHAVAAAPGCPLGRLRISPDRELDAIRGWSVGAVTGYPRRPVHRLFEEWVGRTPEAVALVACDAEGAARETLSYAALNAAANRLAHRLVAAGVGPGERVALVLGRSAASVIATLAVLKAAAAYVPIDPDYPGERIAWMIEDVRAAAIVSTPDDAKRIPAGFAWIDLQSPPARQSDADLGWDGPADAPAYIMFTSGSTGRPKGVVVPHHEPRRVCRRLVALGHAAMAAPSVWA
jgi:non-ribosomal peptide synthetase component F